MKSKKEINWAIIGCGDVTEVKSGPGLYKSKNSNLIGVYNRTYEKAVDYAKRHRVDKVYKSSDDLLQDDDVDVVYIATPPNTHFPYTISALNAGKIPYIEKPMVLNLSEALEIKSLSEERGITPYVAFYRRGLEKFIKIKKIIESGIIGDIRVVNVQQLMQVSDNERSSNKPWRVIPEISGGGKFLDVGTHVLDCLIWFLGEIVDSSSMVTNLGGYYETDDTISTTFRFRSGIIGSGSWCFVADRHFSEVQIIGERGNITYDGLSAKNFYLTIEGETTEYKFNVPEHISMPYQQSIINELTTGETSNASFSDAINLVRMCDQIYNS